VNISVVTSIYMDGHLAKDFCIEVSRVLALYLDVPESELDNLFEIIFVNDGSTDDSLQHLLNIKREFRFIRVIDLSRNFGQHEALACGYRQAKGMYVIRMNVDMQDPPKEATKLLAEITTGEYDLVVGRYALRNSPWFDRLTAFLYFELFKVMTGLKVMQSTAALRVMNRAFIDSYNELTEKSRFPQGLDQWLGFRQKYVEIQHRSRIDGGSSYTFWSRSRLAINGILYFTDRPLKFIGYFGLWMAVLGLVLGFVIVVQKLTGNTILPGYTSLAAAVLFGFGMQIGCIGLLGLYIGRIFREVQNRPLYLVREIY
jgi:glycosyltransferase involved in cell wall biosynthesis